MSWFFHHHPTDSTPDRLEAVLTANVEAQERAQAAASDTSKAARHHQARIEATRNRIQDRIAKGERRSGQTSEVRCIVEEMLADMDSRSNKGTRHEGQC